MLAQMSNLLTDKQKRDLAAAHQMMSDMNFRVTTKQVGIEVGALLASIGIPLAIEAVKKLTGRGTRGGAAVRIGSRIGAAMRLGRPPPFICTWQGRGKKKAQMGQGLILGKNSPFNKIPIIVDIL